MNKLSKLLTLLLVLALLCVGLVIGIAASDTEVTDTTATATSTPTADDSLSGYAYLVYASEADFIADIENGVVDGLVDSTSVLVETFGGIVNETGSNLYLPLSNATNYANTSYYYYVLTDVTYTGKAQDGSTQADTMYKADATNKQILTVNLGNHTMVMNARINTGNSSTLLSKNVFNIYNGNVNAGSSISANFFCARAGSTVNFKNVTFDSKGKSLQAIMDTGANYYFDGVTFTTANGNSFMRISTSCGNVCTCGYFGEEFTCTCTRETADYVQTMVFNNTQITGYSVLFTLQTTPKENVITSGDPNGYKYNSVRSVIDLICDSDTKIQLASGGTLNAVTYNNYGKTHAVAEWQSTPNKNQDYSLSDIRIYPNGATISALDVSAGIPEGTPVPGVKFLSDKSMDVFYEVVEYKTEANYLTDLKDGVLDFYDFTNPQNPVSVAPRRLYKPGTFVQGSLNVYNNGYILFLKDLDINFTKALTLHTRTGTIDLGGKTVRLLFDNVSNNTINIGNNLTPSTAAHITFKNGTLTCKTLGTAQAISLRTGSTLKFIDMSIEFEDGNMSGAFIQDGGGEEIVFEDVDFNIPYGGRISSVITRRLNSYSNYNCEDCKKAALTWAGFDVTEPSIVTNYVFEDLNVIADRDVVIANINNDGTVKYNTSVTCTHGADGGPLVPALVDDVTVNFSADCRFSNNVTPFSVAAKARVSASDIKVIFEKGVRFGLDPASILNTCNSYEGVAVSYVNPENPEEICGVNNSVNIVEGDVTYVATVDVSTFVKTLATGEQVNYFTNTIDWETLTGSGKDAGTSIKLYSDIAYSTTDKNHRIYFGGNFTLDLNGYEFLMEKEGESVKHWYAPATGYTVLITGGGTMKTIGDNMVMCATSYSDGMGTLRFEGVTIVQEGALWADQRAGYIELVNCNVNYDSTATSFVTVHANTEAGGLYIDDVEFNFNGNEKNIQFISIGTHGSYNYGIDYDFTVKNSEITCARLIIILRAYYTEGRDINVKIDNSKINTPAASIQYAARDYDQNFYFSNSKFTADPMGYKAVGSRGENTHVYYGSFDENMEMTKFDQILVTTDEKTYDYWVTAAPALKTNLTLYTDINFNLYIPTRTNITSVKVGDTVYTVGEGLPVYTDQAGSYYKIHYTTAAKAAAEDVAVEVTYTVDDVNCVATTGFSTVDYAEQILANAAYANAQPLMNAVVNYIDNAYTYFGSADNAKLDALTGSELYKAPKVDTPPYEADTEALSAVIASAQFELYGDIRLVLNVKDTALSETFTVKVGNEIFYNAKANAEGKVRVSIRADYLVKDITIICGEIQGTYSFANYATAVGEGAEQNLANMLNAIYAYAFEASAYKASLQPAA